jgi:predicted aldo/keto reductase-like oxidoreductase
MLLHVADIFYSSSPDMSFVRTALPAAIERGVGILAIKVFGNAFLLRTFSVPNCLKYTLSLPGVTACPLGFNTIGQVEDDVRVAQNFKPLSDEEKTALEKRASSKGWDITNGPALEYWKVR